MNNQINTKNNSLLFLFFFHLAIIECLVFSGGAYIMSVYLGKNSIALVIFLMTSILLCLFSRKRKFQQINTIKLLFILVWVISVTYVFGQGIHDMTFLKYILFAMGMFFIISSTGFETYRKLLLNYLVILSAISIFVQLDHDYIGVLPTNPWVNNEGEIHNYTFVFNTEWGENRLASIYWEPGQYQIVIFYTLVLFADEWSDIARWKQSLKKFGVLLIAIIMTLSTTAYLTLMIVLLTVLVRSGRKYMVYMPVFFLLGGGAIYALYNSEAIQKKVDQSENDNQRSSYTIRLADNIGCLMVTLEDPFTGFGPGSNELESRLFSEGSITSSNGWLYGSAQLGIPFIIFLWICLWKNLKRLCFQTNTLLLFMLLVLSQCNESNICYPYLLMYIFNFPYQKRI